MMFGRIAPALENFRTRLLSWPRGTLWATAGGAVLLIAASVLGYFAAAPVERPDEFWKELKTSAVPLTRVAYSEDGRYLAAGTATGEVMLWEPYSGIHQTYEPVSEHAITSLTASRNGFLLAGSGNGQLAFLGIATADTRTIPNLGAAVTSIAIHPHAFEIAVGLADGSLRFLEESAGKRSQIPSPHEGSIKMIAYAPGGKIFVTGGSDGQLIWWNAKSRKVATIRDDHTSEIAALAFSTDGQLLASGDWDGNIFLWNTNPIRQTARLTQPDAVSAISWTPHHLVTGSWDGRLRFWSPQRSRTVREIDVGSAIYDLSLNIEDGIIATLSEQNRLQLWRAPAE